MIGIKSKDNPNLNMVLNFILLSSSYLEFDGLLRMADMGKCRMDDSSILKIRPMMAPKDYQKEMDWEDI